MEQTKSFYSLTNDILLRINTYETDSSTKSFLKNYVPFLAEKPDQHSGWTAHPPVEDTNPAYTVRHSIEFLKHPYIDFGTSKCRLEFLTNERNNKIVGFQSYFIIFLFDNKQEAIRSFDAFCKEYDKLSDSKNIIKRSDKQIAIFKNTNGESLFERVEFILTQDDLYDNKYKIIFGQILDSQFEDYYRGEH